MQNEQTGQVHTAHTTNFVPLVYVGRAATMIDNGSLCDVAPSMLYLMNMPIPPEMTGTPLIELLPASAEQTQPTGKVEVHG